MNREIIQESRILAIDDKPANVLLLQRMLQQGGYQNFCGVTDSRKALATFAEFKPDLVALDLRMPHIDGFEFLRSVRLWLPEDSFVPVLVVTAESSLKTKQEALALGAKDYLAKPIDVNELLLRVYNLLETRWLHRKLAGQNEALEIRVRERTRDLEEAQWEILDRLALASELRDDDTGRHTHRVGILSAMLAEAVGLPPDQVNLIRRAAPLHDLGKIGVPDGILLKPASLTVEERERVKSHTNMGARILSGSRFPILQMAERIALYHHEHWNGSGYHGLKGEDIPVEARIVSIADVFDVILHARPYKVAQTMEAAWEALRKGRGNQFDPRLVDVFLSVIAKESITRLSQSLELDSSTTVTTATPVPVHSNQ
ncbi:MAG: HD domain-containing phosphohydrolase [Acidobacteriota bacterium]